MCVFMKLQTRCKPEVIFLNLWKVLNPRPQTEFSASSFQAVIREWEGVYVSGVDCDTYSSIQSIVLFILQITTRI